MRGHEQSEDGIVVSLGVQFLWLWREAEIWGGCFRHLDPARMGHQEITRVSVCVNELGAEGGCSEGRPRGKG